MTNRLVGIVLVNVLTISRLLVGILGVAFFYSSVFRSWLGLVLIYILVSDLLDGFLARRFGLQTDLGGLLDYVIDRCNFYMYIGILIHEGLPPLIFLPWFLRDLLYVGVQAYVALPRIRGTKALSFVGTITTYLYVFFLSTGSSPSDLFTAVLFCALLASLINMSIRIIRVRVTLVKRLRQDIQS
jgi:cardiolipin synthase (CMP-forming)